MMEVKKLVFNELKSTNAYALEHFCELDMGSVVIANIQTGGRGRFDRVWESNSSDNIYMSFVIKPKSKDNFPYMNLTQYLSVTVNKIFNEEYGICSDIKWPNDILFEGKKFVGILSEAKAEHGELQGAVLGIGINVNTDTDFYKNLPNATSMKIIKQKQFDKDKLIDLITERFMQNFEDFEQNGFKSIAKEYFQMCKFHSETVKLQGSFMDGEYKFAGLNDDGTFSVTDSQGEKIQVLSGDILC